MMLIHYAQTESPFVLAFLIVPITISVVIMVIGVLFLLKKRLTKKTILSKLTASAPYTDKLTQATAYRQQIIALIKEKTAIKENASLTALIPQVETWAAHVQKLVQRLQAYQADGLLQKDQQAIPTALARLQAEAQTETDPYVQSQLQKTIAEYDRQYDHLQQLAKLMRRTELELEQTLAAMGSIYSQLQLMQSMDIDSRRATNLAEGLDEQVKHLDDLLEAMQEVYQENSY